MLLKRLLFALLFAQTLTCPTKTLRVIDSDIQELRRSLGIQEEPCPTLERDNQEANNAFFEEFKNFCQARDNIVRQFSVVRFPLVTIAQIKKEYKDPSTAETERRLFVVDTEYKFEGSGKTPDSIYPFALEYQISRYLLKAFKNLEHASSCADVVNGKKKDSYLENRSGLVNIRKK